MTEKTDRVILPDRLMIEMVRDRKTGMCAMRMREDFFDADEEMLERTMQLFTKLSGEKVKVYKVKKGHRLAITMQDSVEEIGNVLAMEFLFWSTIGNTTLRTLFTNIIQNAVENAEAKK